jgi:hypothetical protein
MQLIPIQPVPSQQLSIVLAGQSCQISIYTRGRSMYVDVSVNGNVISSCVLAQNQNILVPNAYNGFSGQLVFFDLQGSTNPVYTGLGTRYVLGYFAAAELASGTLATS